MTWPSFAGSSHQRRAEMTELQYLKLRVVELRARVKARRGYELNTKQQIEARIDEKVADELELNIAAIESGALEV
jgi:hypothetical protein